MEEDSWVYERIRDPQKKKTRKPSKTNSER